MLDTHKQIKKAIETENTAQITMLLWVNDPSENNEEYIHHKQKIFISFITLAHLFWLRDKTKVSLFVKQIIIVLHKIGFVSKRKGDILPHDSKKLLTMLGQIEHEDCKQHELNEIMQKQLQLFVELLHEAASESTDVSMSDNTTMNIRRKDDIPTLKLKNISLKHESLDRFKKRK